MRFPTEKKKPIIRNNQKIKNGKIKNPRILAIREAAISGEGTENVWKTGVTGEPTI